MRVALVCDWLIGGGAERVVEALHETYPEAPIFTGYINSTQREVFKNADIHVLWPGRLPFASALRKFVPLLRERAFEKLNLSDYDVVISVGSAESKGVRTGPNTKHIYYCFSPTHYYWVRYDEYLKNPGFGAFDGLARLGLRLLISGRRKWDFAAAQRPDVVVGISHAVNERVAKFYKRDSQLIFPPVDIERFQINPQAHRQGFVTAGRQAPYKRFDIAVEAAVKTNQELVVIGRGPEHDKLQALGGPNTHFLNNVSDPEMMAHFQSAQAFLFTSDEDFGITPVEAMACGTPVIAYKAGGALDTVREGETGVFYTSQTPASLAQAMQNFNPTQFNPATIRKHAEQFSAEHFKAAFTKLVAGATKKS